MNPRTLTGLAMGDALGMPFEQREHTDPFLRAWDGTFQACPDTHPFCKGLKPGQWTDDTKMAMALAASLVSAKTYSPADVANRYLAWYRSRDWRGMGTATRTALEVLSKGGLWLESGTKGAEGNGTAMRIAPLGLFLRGRKDDVIADCARLDATITHDSLEAREGAVIVALSVAHLANGRPREDLIEYLSDCNAVQDSKVLSRTRDVDHYVRQIRESSPAVAVSIAATVLKTGGHVVETVPAALFCFLSTHSLSEAVELAVRAGGDTDTTAAVTGALSGTFYGVGRSDPYSLGLEGCGDLMDLDHQLLLGP